ncbi:MAG: TolC family protein [Gemmatimonadaceae bacterium]|nr:TolC family protein [Gemmatimonadaceae bacterium]
MTRRRTLGVLITLASGALRAQTGDARAITLDEAVRLAQQNAPQAVQARNAVRTGGAALRTARFAYAPTLNVTANTAKQGGETFFQGQLVPFRGDPWSYSKGVTSQLELFDGGRRWFNLKSANANLDAADASETLQRYQVALSVKQQYFAALAAREAQAAAAAQFAQADAQFKVAAARVKAGAATISDSLRSEITVGNARLAALNAQNDLRNANAALTRLVASTTTVTAIAGDTAEIAGIALDDAALAALVEQGPSVRSAAAAFAAARAGRKAAIAPYMPTMNLSYSLNGNAASQRFDPTGRPFAAQNATRVTLNFPLFNGFQREETYTRTSVAEQNAEAQFRDAKLLALQQLTQFLGAFRTAEQRVLIQQASIASALEDVRVQQRRYELGAATILEIAVSQATLNSARAGLISARFDARVAKAQIEALVGRDLK